MGIGEELQPAIGIFSGGFANLASYAWVLIPLLVLVAVAVGFFVYSKIKDKEKQWTHTLKVRRVLQNGLLTDAVIHRMRRFPLIKKAEVFELEKPLLGGYLLPELDEYSGHNEFSIILDKNNRIYTNKGEFFNPGESNVYVSAKHSEIDIQRQNLKANFQNVNKVNKRVEWSEIAKYAMVSIAIIAITLIAIVSLQKWGESQEFQSSKAQAEAKAMEELNKALESIEANSNVNLLVLEKLKNLYGTNNIQAELTKIKDENA
jgi:uncharacterized protein YbjQ (UPF0145 family)